MQAIMLSLSYTTYNNGIVPPVMNCWISFVRVLTNRYKYASAPHWESFGDGRDGCAADEYYKDGEDHGGSE